MCHEGYQEYSDSIEVQLASNEKEIEVQLASKEKECNWQNATWQEVSVQWPWKEFIWYNILFHLILFYIISWQKIRRVALLTFKRVHLVQHYIFQGWNERWTSGTNMKVKILSMNWQVCTKFTLWIRCTPNTLTQLQMKIHKQMLTGIESNHWSWLTFSC